MLNILFFDDENLINQLKPFSFTRPICEFRVGIMTIKEKWEKIYNTKAYYQTQFHLSGKFPSKIEAVNLIINGSIIPDKALSDRILHLPLHHALTREGTLIALKLDAASTRQYFGGQGLEQYGTAEWPSQICQIQNIWDIFTMNDAEIKKDFELICKDRKSQKLSETNQLLGSSEMLFIEEGASVECSILNTKTGPIYIGKDAEVLEGCMLRGPLAMCEHSATKMGTKIYGATTLGPHCKVGGELNNSVMFGYSNKGHDGFLGNSVIGEWCNLGADTNNSNLKNNYSQVKVWNYDTESYENTGLQFCGLFMGDHSKSGINTMFNTGTVVGVSANIFGAGFPEKFIPSFSWGGAEGMKTYRAEEAIDAAERMMKRRNIDLTYEDEQILRTVYEEDMDFRNWDDAS